MRTPFIAGNWKLNKTISEARAFAAEFGPLVQDVTDVQIGLFPVFTSIPALSEALGGSNVEVGGQDFYWKASGAYTGEVSLPLLEDAGAKLVLIGHSERRGRFGVPEPDLEGEAGRVFGETDHSVNKKLLAALGSSLTPIVCVGETLTERQNGHTDAVVENQTVMALDGVEASQVASIVFAYEPVWAIGTGEVCAADEANRVCGVIRATVASKLGAQAGEAVRIQYGGSVKPDNARELLALEHIDGALVGGASLKADSFAQIVQAARG
ncbi:triosephosphate isomerase [Abditibacteriota bacterium]|nr:triosephosphate isomerase [Abditibacteriota bacterium]